MKNLIKFYVTAYINIAGINYLQIVGPDYKSRDIMFGDHCIYDKLEAEIFKAVRSIRKNGQNFTFVINEEDEFMGKRIFKPEDNIMSDMIADNGKWKIKLTNEEKKMFWVAFSKVVRL